MFNGQSFLKKITIVKRPIEIYNESTVVLRADGNLIPRYIIFYNLCSIFIFLKFKK